MTSAPTAESAALATESPSTTDSPGPDLSFCEREPIHIPGAIQPHGAVLAVQMRTGLISHASANLETFLGCPVKAVLGRPLMEAIGDQASRALLDEGDRVDEPILDRVHCLQRSSGPSLRLRAYRSSQYVCIDIEPILGPASHQLPIVLAHVLRSFADATSATEFCELAVWGLKAMTGYDRVMAYRFGEAGHGEVIAEAREAHLEPFLGLRYPASDIPPQARQLYLRQRVGAIADSSYTPELLLADPALADGTPLDLTHSALRSVSPLHREYMRNMKTSASLTIGMAHEHELRGMLVCHHMSPRIATPEMRAAAGTIGEVGSLLLQRLADLERSSRRHLRNATLTAVVDRIAAPLTLPDALVSADVDLLALADAAGALLRVSGASLFLGRTPPAVFAERTLATMRSQAGGDVFAFDDLHLRFPELAEPSGAGGGALLLPLSPDSDDAILWFRPELANTVTWGGDPNAHGSVDAEGRIAPRVSFAAWQETVRGRSAPWTAVDLAIAVELGSAFREEVAHRTTMALRESEARLGLLAEHSGVVVSLTDLDGTRRYVSPASERVLGWRAEDLVGRAASDFIHPDDREVALAATVRLLSGNGESSVTYRFRRPDGSWLWVDGQARLREGTKEDRPTDYIVVLRDATERKATEVKLLEALERMEQMAATDGLTGLANRRHLDVAAGREWSRCAREHLPLSALMVDADRFKLFNDRYGHLAGDDCLRAIAAQLTAAARRPADVAARYGGEEFVLLLPGTGPDGAACVAERLCRRIPELGLAHEGNGEFGVVTVSIGIATAWPEDAAGEYADTVALFLEADAALYLAKAGGRNRVVVGGTGRGPRGDGKHVGPRQ